MKKSIDMTGWIMKEHGFPESKLTVIEKELNHKNSNSIYWKWNGKARLWRRGLSIK